jgi:hypothetical protein
VGCSRCSSLSLLSESLLLALLELSSSSLWRRFSPALLADAASICLGLLSRLLSFYAAARRIII